MLERRFCFLLRCLRFDDTDTWEEQRQEDKFAVVREMWDTFIKKCTGNYTPHENITVDEQLLDFRVRCSFRQYIGNKPTKYGLMLVMASDVQSKYMVSAIPYLGTHTKPPPGVLLGEYFTTELMKPYFHTQRTVTRNNFFTSHPLAASLESLGVSIVGTMRKTQELAS
ncbi:PiggyBac transposable element-derived protein 4-like 16 [Homarus americanus]|uniref:PiggyBac transposable element-derived protein 4-like 16 n=1 Tax=Homarus americanus TaxID=6706 RepID=A0A8J5N4M1_HOMAM|nr:PiggyBac transposable element-derived protein 4-like 16 [Homarus americanus]